MEKNDRFSDGEQNKMPSERINDDTTSEISKEKIPSTKHPEKKDRTVILEHMPVKKAIWVLAVPTMVAMLIQTIYNMTDTFFIGQLNDPNMVAAIALCMPIAILVQTFGQIFAVGGSSLISRLLGQKELKKANHAGSISFWSALTICTTTTIIAIIFMEPMLKLVGASANTMAYAKSYLTIMLMGGPFMGMQMTFGGLLRSEGATKEAMIGMMSGSILNMILDPIFILVLHWGIAGAALATTIGNLLGFSYYLLFYLRKKGIISISIKNFVFEKRYFADIFKIGIPASLGMVLMSVGMIVSNIYAAGFGDNVVAANGIVMRVTNIVIMLVMGMGQGCQPLLGYSYGSKRFDRLFETIKRAITANTIICVSFAIIFYTFARVWIQVFMKNTEVLDLGVKILRVMVYSMPFMGTQVILMTTFQSLGKTVQSLIITLGRQGLFFIPAIMIFSSVWGFEGYIYAQPFSNIFTALLSIVLYLGMRKKLLAQSRETDLSHIKES